MRYGPGEWSPHSGIVAVTCRTLLRPARTVSSDCHSLRQDRHALPRILDLATCSSGGEDTHLTEVHTVRAESAIKYAQPLNRATTRSRCARGLRTGRPG